MFKRLRRRKCLKKIKQNLSEDFKIVHLNTDNLPELASLLLDTHGTSVIKAKIDKNDEVNLIIENVYGIVYEAKTTNYEWFIDNITF